MNKSSEEFVKRIIDLVQSESRIDFNQLDEQIVHKILFSAHCREECSVPEGEEISGQTLAFLLASYHVAKEVRHFGIRIKGLTISDKLDLDSVKIEFPLVFKECIFKEDIILRDARTKYLSFEGSKCQYINASRIVVNGSLSLNGGFFAAKGIELNNAKIYGNISLGGATVEPIQEQTVYRGKSLVLDCATIGGNLWLWSKNKEENFKSRGEISLIGAVIEGNFICRNAKLKSLKSDDQYFNSEHGEQLTLTANSAIVKGTIEFSESFEAEGQMLLMNMEVHGDVKCEGGTFSHSQPSDDCQPVDSHKHAISFDRSIIDGSIFLRDGFEATGQVRLIGTTIKGDLDCSGGSFSVSPYAEDCFTVFIARSLIQGDVSFCKTQLGRDENLNFETNGLIYLNSVKIGTNLDLTRGVKFNKNHLKVAEKVNGLRAHNCIVNGWIKFRKITPNNETIISLSGTTSGGLDHNWNVFFTKERVKELAIDRFVYDKYESKDDNGLVNNSMEWLKLLDQSDDSSTDKEKAVSLNRSLGCYQQLATVLTKNGRRHEAVEILIDMEEKRISQRGRFGKFFSWILKHAIGFGYRPFKALKPAFIVIIFSGFIFQQGYKQKAFYPNNVEASKRHEFITDKKFPFEYPSFHPFIYSLEEFFPVINIDFGVRKNWQINDGAELAIGPVKFSSEILEKYYWLHKFVGWIISTLIVGGFTAFFIRKIN